MLKRGKTVRRVSQWDIAREANVSRVTVSLVLAGKDQTSEATRKRVLEVAERMRYRPNLLVQGMQSGRTGVIGVLVPAAMQFQGQIARGIHDELMQHDYVAIQLLGEPAPAADEQKELQQIHRLVDRRVDGMIIWPADASVADMHFREIWERQIPLVTVDRETTSHADHVGTDEEFGGKLAADHLHSLGHRRVAHMTYPSRPGSITRRREAFVRAFTKGGGEVEVLSGEREQLNDVARQLMELSPRPTAIFAATDIMAMKVYAAAAAMGLRIPDDLSVIGYADLPFAVDMYPPLTTVRQDPVLMGRMAGRILLDRILERITSKTPQKLFLKPELVVRQSTRSIE